MHATRSTKARTHYKALYFFQILIQSHIIMRFKHIYVLCITILMMNGLNSCQKSNNYSGTTTTPPSISFQVKTDSHFGSVITDNKGNTLYNFSLDANGSSACTGNCLTTWPVVYIASPTFGTGLAASDFSTITRSDGAKQTTYKGWPLYRFAGDAAVGDILGDGIDGIWFVAKPDYTVMMAKTQLVG